MQSIPIFFEPATASRWAVSERESGKMREIALARDFSNIILVVSLEVVVS
jgi:hypothetical protein